METLIVILIIAVAAVSVGRMLYRRFRRQESCACGCGGCAIVDSCNLPKGSDPHGGAPSEKST